VYTTVREQFGAYTSVQNGIFHAAPLCGRPTLLYEAPISRGTAVASFDVGSVILGKYEITRVLGKGGMGLVVAARHRELDQLVALKFLLPAFAAERASCARFSREARTAIRIKDEHVARVYDVGTVDGTPFLVMEYLTGEDLARVLRRRGPLPVAEAVDLLLQACEAVAEAHHLGIVHRDLKPANLFVTTKAGGAPLVKVLDFGISKSTVTAADDPSATESAAVIGSPRYMSPEQLRSSKTVDARTDVWALGVILYEMLTGRAPFPGESIAEVATEHFRGTYARPSERRPEIPAALDETIAEALAHDRQARLPSVEAFAARVAPFGSDAARASRERIARIAASALPPDAGALEATIADGPPSSAIEPAGSPSARVATSPVRTAPTGASQARPRRRRATAALVGAGAMLAVAAIAYTRSTASSRTSAAPPVCPLEADKGNACHECRDQSCCAQYVACHDSSACGEYLDCFNACETPSCKLACMQSHAAGHAIAAPYLACADVRCAGPCGGGAGSGACDNCRQANCPGPLEQCLSDPACDALRECMETCRGDDEGCRQRCRKAASGATQALYNALFACGTLYCTSTCS